MNTLPDCDGETGGCHYIVLDRDEANDYVVEEVYDIDHQCITWRLSVTAPH